MAITFPNRVWFRPESLPDSATELNELLIHELTHVAQWRRLGSIRFLWRYLSAYIAGRLRGLKHSQAYRQIPLEVEAVSAAQRWVRSTGEHSDQLTSCESAAQGADRRGVI